MCGKGWGLLLAPGCVLWPLSTWKCWLLCFRQAGKRWFTNPHVSRWKSLPLGTTLQFTPGPGAPRAAPGSPLPGKHLGQLLLLAVMLLDSCPSWKHLEHSLFRGNLESFSPFQTETEFQLPQVFIFLEITLSSQVSISFLRCLNLYLMGISKKDSPCAWIQPQMDLAVLEPGSLSRWNLEICTGSYKQETKYLHQIHFPSTCVIASLDDETLAYFHNNQNAWRNGPEVLRTGALVTALIGSGEQRNPRGSERGRNGAFLCIFISVHSQYLCCISPPRGQSCWWY